MPGWLNWVTLDFGSGHDLMICGLEPRVGLCADSAEPAWDILSLSLSLPLSPSLCSSPACVLSLSQKNFLKNSQNYLKIKRLKKF